MAKKFTIGMVILTKEFAKDNHKCGKCKRKIDAGRTRLRVHSHGNYDKLICIECINKLYKFFQGEW